MKTLEFVPYGVVVDGRAERARYARHLQGYLAATLLPVFAAWEGELPEHLQKVHSQFCCACCGNVSHVEPSIYIRSMYRGRKHVPCSHIWSVVGKHQSAMHWALSVKSGH